MGKINLYNILTLNCYNMISTKEEFMIEGLPCFRNLPLASGVESKKEMNRIEKLFKIVQDFFNEPESNTSEKKTDLAKEDVPEFPIVQIDPKIVEMLFQKEMERERNRPSIDEHLASTGQ